MIRSIRAYFLSRALREKLLLVAFVAIGVLWWASAFSTRAGRFWREQRSTTVALTEQAQWLEKRTVIEDKAKQTARGLDSSKTLNGNALVTTVSQLASDAGLKGAQTSGSRVTRTEGQFAVHSQEFLIRSAEWDALKKFYESVQQKSPYIAMERFTLLGPPANSPQHILTLKVTSVEIVR